jgi:hypothetical protein
MGYKKGDPVNISDAFESYGESQRRGEIAIVWIVNGLSKRRIHCW